MFDWRTREESELEMAKMPISTFFGIDGKTTPGSEGRVEKEEMGEVKNAKKVEETGTPLVPISQFSLTCCQLCV